VVKPTAGLRGKLGASLGRVDGFDDDEAQSECDEGCEVLVRFLATERKALEALELAHKLLDAGAIERFWEERCSGRSKIRPQGGGNLGHCGGHWMRPWRGENREKRNLYAHSGYPKISL
jgi:hypothetical protein